MWRARQSEMMAVALIAWYIIVVQGCQVFLQRIQTGIVVYRKHRGEVLGGWTTWDFEI